SDLTGAEAKVLHVMLQPASHRKSISRLCAEAGISRSHYYRLLSDPELSAKLRRVVEAVLMDDLVPIMEALKRSALILGREGHADRKLLLEMVGMYKPTRRQTNEEAAKPAAAEADMVRALLQYGAPEDKW